jgi:aspartyl protease family protein
MHTRTQGFHLPLRTLVCVLLALNAPAQAQSSQVQLNGMLGARAALLIIDGEPRTLTVGAEASGVKLVSLQDGQAVIEMGGHRQTLLMGAAPARVMGSVSGPRQIVVPASATGHYTVAGTINGQATSFLIDTGATSVALSQVEADKLGLKYQQGKRVSIQTANGVAPGYLIDVASIRIGEVEVRNVSTVVTPAQIGHVLLGNSFLKRFQMHRENDVMTLELRN